MIRDLALSIVNHVWQSTIFAGLATFSILFFKKNHARIRYSLWLAASVKFLVPFALLTAIGSSIDFGLDRSAGTTPALVLVEDLSRPFGSEVAELPVSAAQIHNENPPIWIVVYAIWFVGAVAVLLSYIVKGWRLKEALRISKIADGRTFEALRRLKPVVGIRQVVELAYSSSAMEPGVIGIFRPVLLLPAGMPERLSDSELEAILVHELAHIRHRDNLAALVHMFVEALFWFHPIVWWLGAKMLQERERACDEEVLRLGKDPQAYAEGILKVCEFYLESPLACVSGVTGSDMKKRIHRIMTHQIGGGLSLTKKILLAGVGASVLSVPLAVGLMNVQPSRAQEEAKPSFEAASVKPAASDTMTISNHQGERFYLHGITLKQMIVSAYGIHEHELSGGPDWINGIRYDLEAKTPGIVTDDTAKLMFQRLLEDRFKLKIHREEREGSVLALQIGKGGHKLKRSDQNEVSGRTSLTISPEGKMRISESGRPAREISPNKGRYASVRAGDVSGLANALSKLLRRTVIDETNIEGKFEISLEWVPDSIGNSSTISSPGTSMNTTAQDALGPSVYEAIQEQLGLKLEPRKGTNVIIVIDSVEKPKEN